MSGIKILLRKVFNHYLTLKIHSFQDSSREYLRKNTFEHALAIPKLVLCILSILFFIPSAEMRYKPCLTIAGAVPCRLPLHLSLIEAPKERVYGRSGDIGAFDIFIAWA